MYFNSIYKLVRSNWHDSYEKQFEIVMEMCSDLDKFLKAAEELACKYNREYKFCLEFLDNMYHQLKKFKKINSRSNISEDMANYMRDDESNFGFLIIFWQTAYNILQGAKEDTKLNEEQIKELYLLAVKIDPDNGFNLIDVDDDLLHNVTVDKKLENFKSKPSLFEYNKLIKQCNSDAEKKKHLSIHK